jgi:hypothetical protein
MYVELAISLIKHELPTPFATLSCSGRTIKSLLVSGFRLVGTSSSSARGEERRSSRDVEASKPESNDFDLARSSRFLKLSFVVTNIDGD